MQACFLKPSGMSPRVVMPKWSLPGQALVATHPDLSAPRASRAWSRSPWLLSLPCLGLGIAATVYGDWVGDNLSRLIIVPAALFCMILFVANKTGLFLALLLIRAPLDPVFESIRLGPMSAGAVLNVFVLLIAAFLIVESSGGDARKHLPSRTPMPMWLPMWLPIILALFVAAARAPEPIQGARTFLAFLTNLAVFIVPFYLSERHKNLRFAIQLILLSSLIPAIYAFVDLAQGGYVSLEGLRISSTFSHPNIFAFYLTFVILLGFYLLKSQRTKLSPLQRSLLAGYLCVLLFELALTKTRSAWAACLLSFIVYGVMFERRYLAYIACAAMFALLIPEINERLLDLNPTRVYWNYGQAQNSYEWRKVLWQSAFDWMKASSLPVGYGLGSFPFHTTEFFPLGGRVQFGAHNVYVQLIFEAGLFGLMSFGWLFARLLVFIRQGMQSDRLGRTTLSGVVCAYLLVCYSDNMLDYLAFNWYLWFLLGTACACIAGHQASRPIHLGKTSFQSAMPSRAGTGAAE